MGTWTFEKKLRDAIKVVVVVLLTPFLSSWSSDALDEMKITESHSIFECYTTLTTAL